MPYHLPKDWSVQSEVCMKGCGRMGQVRESSAPQKGTHQQYKVSCAIFSFSAIFSAKGNQMCLDTTAKWEPAAVAVSRITAISSNLQD